MPLSVSRQGMGRRLNGSRWELGLVGPMRATTPGDAFLVAVAPILADVGPLPHARLNTVGESTAPKWLELAGAPLCPIEDHGRMEHEPLDDEGEHGE